MSKEKINQIILDIAESISINGDTAFEYLSENNIDIDKFILKGFNEISLSTKDKKEAQLSRSKSFFRRLVLAAEIVNSYHKEKRFGSVKFQKMVYLCEQVSNMKFCTNYTKQAAGPFDNKFMHSIRTGFLKQKWFNVEKIKDKSGSRVIFTPLENYLGYKKYYSNYFQSVDKDIQFLIDTFRNSLTRKVELVATIFSCWMEIIEKKELFSDLLLQKRIYEWHPEKNKFSNDEIIETKSWMIDKGIVPYNYRI